MADHKVNRNNPEMTQMLELAGKDFKITIMNMFFKMEKEMNEKMKF